MFFIHVGAVQRPVRRRRRQSSGGDQRRPITERRRVPRDRDQCAERR